LIAASAAAADTMEASYLFDWSIRTVFNDFRSGVHHEHHSPGTARSRSPGTATV
jgi:hypothetical protein